MQFEMGSQVEDVICGFKGTVTGYVRYITGCNQYLVSPKLKDGEVPKAQWLDESRLKQGNGETIVIQTPFGENGPDIQAPTK